jgi:hypothetical protein
MEIVHLVGSYCKDITRGTVNKTLIDYTAFLLYLGIHNTTPVT